MLPEKIAFVDIETTGTGPATDSIIEIAILRVENNKLVKTYQTLINPFSYVSPFIGDLTGITAKDLENAPEFSGVRDEILEMLEGCIFAAHNVRFDYTFLKHAFRRVDRNFTSKYFCTVKLSQALYPQYKHHDLDSIINRFNFGCENRHRAYDDAKILWDFYQMVQKKFSKEKVETAFSKILKHPSIPTHMSFEDIEKINEGPGVYIFYDQRDTVLYVGKSINMKNRVLSHFSDYETSRKLHMLEQVKRIETIAAAGELGALILESTLIKSLMPIYNRVLRVSHKLVVAKRKKEKDYDSVYLETVETITSAQLSDILGIFKSSKQAKNFLLSLADEFDLCHRFLSLENTKRHCFRYGLGTCRGACAEKESSLKYNMRFAQAFAKHKIKAWPFKSAIYITEKNIDGLKETFVVDNWCYLGSIKEDQNDSQNILKNDFTFDKDIYKILLRFIANKRNWKHIKQISTSLPELNAFVFA